MTLRDVLAVIFRRKFLILSIFAVTTLIVGYRTMTAPTTYTADATLLLNRQGARSSVLERVSRQLPWVEVIESEIEVLQSTPVLQMALAKLRNPEEGEPLDVTLGALSSSIKAGIIGESNVLYVSGTSKTRAVAPRITNAVAESYVEYHDQLYELPDPVGFISARADSVFRLMERLEQERSDILRAIGSGDVGHQNQLLTTERERLRRQLAENQRTIATLQTQVADARTFLESEKAALPFTENTGTVQGGSMVSTFRMLNTKTDELRQLREKYTAKHPLVIEAEQAVASLRESVEDHVSELIAVREHELRVAQSVASKLREQLDEVNAEIEGMLGQSGRLETLAAQIRTLREQHSELSEQSVDSEIVSESFRDYSVKILSPAIGARVNAKADMVRLALGPILSLMFGIGLAFYLENLDHSLSNRDDIEQHLEIPVLASFPDSDDALQEPPVKEDAVPYRRKGSGVRT